MNELVKGSFFWVKLMTDDKHEPAECTEIKGVMSFKFSNGVCVPCASVTDYEKCVYYKETFKNKWNKSDI